MNKLYNSKLTGISKTLRKNMTKEEKHLWYDFLKEQGITVLHYTNLDINKNFDAVCTDILRYIDTSSGS